MIMKKFEKEKKRKQMPCRPSEEEKKIKPNKKIPGKINVVIQSKKLINKIVIW